MDGLPLALTIAGASLRDDATNFDKYLEYHNTSWTKVQRKSQKLSHYDQTLLTTWDVALERVKKKNQDSEGLLLLWGYFDNQDIWWDMLKDGREATTDAWFRRITEHELSFSSAMRPLCQYALAEPNPVPPKEGGGSRGYSMHPCVHEWVKNGLNEDEKIWNQDKKAEMKKLVVSCLARHVPRMDPPNFTIVRERLNKHADRCWQVIREMPRENDDVPWAESMHELGVLYTRIRALDRAEELFKRALEVWEKELGHDHLATLRTVNNLGVVYRHQRRLNMASEMLHRALAGKLKTLLPGDQYYVSTYIQLGVLYEQQNQLLRAEEFYRCALEASEKVEHEKRNQLPRAEEFYALEVSKKVERKDDSDILRTARSLGLLCSRDQKKLGEAEKLLQRAWRGYERLRGAEHHLTVSIILELASVYEKQKRFAEAEDLLREAWKRYEEVVHESTQRTGFPFSDFYERRGNISQAEWLKIQILDNMSINPYRRYPPPTPGRLLICWKEGWKEDAS